MSDEDKVVIELGEFEGKPIVGVLLEVRGVAGGLNRAAAVFPVVLHHGEDAVVAFKINTKGIRIDPVDDDERGGPQNRVQITDSSKAGILTGELGESVARYLDEQEDRIVEHEERAEAERERLKEEARQKAEIEKNRGKGQEPIVEGGEVNPDAVPPEEHRTDEVGEKRAAKKTGGTKKTVAKKAAPVKKATKKRAPAKRASRATKRPSH